MTILFQSNFFTNVTKVNDSEIVVNSHLLSTDYEATGRIRATTAFTIQEARWDIYRSPQGTLNGGSDVPSLIGEEAYLKAGGALKAVGKEQGDLPKELLAECVRGIIQAETYLFKERGFLSQETYEDFWKKNYRNSCRLYSNPERITQSWYAYIAHRKWGEGLFNRFKTVVVRVQEDGSLFTVGGFTDSFHELGVKLVIAAGVIKSCTGDFLRAPDPVCVENVCHLSTVSNLDISTLTKRELSSHVGGEQGCCHLLDLLDYTLHAARAIKQPEVYSDY